MNGGKMRNPNLPTKTAKKIKMYYQKVECRNYWFQCPACAGIFPGMYGINERTTRFRCECGQEMIIESFTERKHPFSGG
jgi:hypothetical protein